MMPYDRRGVSPPIGFVSNSPQLLVRIRKCPYRRAGACRLGEKHPGKLNFATAGVGTLRTSPTIVQRMETGIAALNVPSRAERRLTAVIGTAGCPFRSGAQPPLKSGEVRALAITGHGAATPSAGHSDAERSGIPL